MIAKALSQDSQLCLLDEPSAYLDIEQRLVAAKVIRSLMETTGNSCAVVDHDLLFIDNISDRIMHFTGIPAVSGEGKGPFSPEDGMNALLEDVDITLRREHESGRPRINKPGSVKDREQKMKGSFYYS